MKEKIKFSVKNFKDVQERIFGIDQGEKYLSKHFRSEVTIRLSIKTPASMFKDFKRWGYLFRVTEEKFGNFPKISEKRFLSILTDVKSSASDRLYKATNYLDAKVNTTSLEGLEKDYLIVPEIAPVFTGYIWSNIKNIINLLQEKKLDILLKKDVDLDILNEVLFRNSIWGYLYRLAEEQLEI